MATQRQLFFDAVHRKNDKYIPFDFDLCPSLAEEFEKRTGVKDYKEYYKMPLRFCHAPCKINIADNFHFARYYKNPQPDVEYSEWGIGIKKGSVAHFVQMLHPMENFTSPQQIREYPYPHPENDYNWERVHLRVKELKAKDCVVYASNGATLFELAWVLRSMEAFAADMLEAPEMVDTLLDKIMDFKMIFVENYIAAGVDGIQFGDDIATQLDMMMSPELWRHFLKPRLAKLIARAKELNPNVIIEYHTDGNARRVIPELIEIGVEVLNPVQPECMNPAEIKNEYGDRLSFRGCLGTQTTMPFGTQQDVRKACAALIRDVGKGGGLILSPSHVLEPEVPFENIEAYIHVVQEFNLHGISNL